MNSTPESVLHRLMDALEWQSAADVTGALTERVRLHAALPGRHIDLIGRAGAAEAMLGWFGTVADSARVYREVGRTGEVWRASWRFTMRRAAADLVVERHAYCTFSDGRVDSVRLVGASSPRLARRPPYAPEKPRAGRRRQHVTGRPGGPAIPGRDRPR